MAAEAAEDPGMLLLMEGPGPLARRSHAGSIAIDLHGTQLISQLGNR